MLIQKLRLQRGWSQQQLAELSGLSVRTIQRIERGQSAGPESLKSLAAVFEIAYSDLIQELAMTTTPTSSVTPPAQPVPPTLPASNITLSKDEILALDHVRRLKRFYLHLFQYLITLTALGLLNFFTSPHHLWVHWVALGWGIGLLSHALAVFQVPPFFGPDWEKRQVEKRLGRAL